MKNPLVKAFAVLVVMQSLAVPAQTDELRLVPPYAVPAAGTFWSLQKLDSEPPLPYDPFPELPVYSLGDGGFLIDDTSVDYAALRAQATAINPYSPGVAPEQTQTGQTWQRSQG